MTVERQNIFSGPFLANGVTVDFPFDFHGASAGEVRVKLNDVDVDASLFTVTLNPDGTGSVTFFVAPLGDLVVYSAPLFTQETNFEDQGPFYQSAVNEPIDRSAIRDLVLLDRTNRSVTAALGKTGLELGASDNGVIYVSAGDMALTDFSAIGGSPIVDYATNSRPVADVMDFGTDAAEDADTIDFGD